MSIAQESSQDMDSQFILRLAQKSLEVDQQIQSDKKRIEQIVQTATSKKQFENGSKQKNESLDLPGKQREPRSLIHMSENISQIIGNMKTNESKRDSESNALDNPKNLIMGPII